MLVLLPPSETKRDGGADGSSLDLGALSHTSLNPARSSAIAALTRLSRSVSESNASLGLGPTQRFEIDRNRALRTSPTMPAIERYTGVLYDGLDAATLDPAARSWLETTVAVHSALFGLISAADPIPAYRLSHNSKLPGMHLARHWRDEVSAVLHEHEGVILDLRSEAYVAMGPAPVSDRSRYLRVVSAASDGTKRALNHFNKKGKGELVRALAESAVNPSSVDELVAWAGGHGIRLEHGSSGSPENELFLVV
jgi:cytoplasmic iron level regulating protein YaaA (DUF328/UPF0246 family)